MKTRTQARCQSCGAVCPRWLGRCPDCGEWGTVVEEPVERSPRRDAHRASVETTRLADHDAGAAARTPTGLEEVDRVLGGGLVAGSVTLLAGEPGVGKSTLTLQLAIQIARSTEVLLVCGEESPEQVLARAVRIDTVPQRIRALQDASLSSVVSAIEALPAGAVVIVDSVQTLFDAEIASAPGSVAQVRECGARIARLAREESKTVVLVGHVTKDGAIAGPRVLEHLVDVVLTFDGDRHAGLRVLRAAKNRFGSTQDAGFFEMTGTGLEAIRDASRYLLQDRCSGQPGSVLAATVEGRRPLVCEVQALVGDTGAPVPRRNAIGLDPTRLALLVAVLTRRLKVALFDKEVYASAVGGIRAFEPALDVAAALAILSAYNEAALPDDLVAFGEVGLAGEVRGVVAADRRLTEAKAVGCGQAVVPASYDGPDGGLKLIRARHLLDLEWLVTPKPKGSSRE